MKRLSLLFIFLFIALASIETAADDICGNGGMQALDITEVRNPKPFRFVDEPEAWFDHSTGMIYIYLDTSAYNEYTLYLTAPTGTSTVYPTTSVVAIPADLARRLTYMLIDSEEFSRVLFNT